MRIKGIKIDEDVAKIFNGSTLKIWDLLPMPEYINRSIDYINNPDDAFIIFRTFTHFLKEKGIKLDDFIAAVDNESRKKLGRIYRLGRPYTDDDLRQEFIEVHGYKDESRQNIKIDEDVARILNKQDNDDTSKYRVYSNDIKDGWSILGTYDDEYSALQVYGAWKLRLLRGNGRYGVYTDVRMFEPGEKAIFSGWSSLYDYVLPHNLPKLNKLIDRLNNSGYWKVNGDEIRVDHGFGTVAEQMDLTDLADEFRKIGFKVYVSPFSIQVLGLEDFIEKQNNKNESIKEDYEWHGPVAKVTFDNGDVIETAINGTDEEIKSYYMGKTFNLGIEEDDMHKVVKVEVIRESMKEGFNKEANNFPEGSFAAWYGEDLTGQTYEGDLNCSHQKLTSLFGRPSVIIGDFDCSNNQLTSLQGAPKEVEGDFDCSRNQLTSLEGSPKEVGESFDCSYNQLTSLEGSPEKVGGYFNCYDNQLTSLEGSPEEVAGYFSCSNNQLTSLKGAPKEVGGDFYCSGNKLTSLEGSPKEVRGDFYCYDNKLKSLEGIGEVIGKIYSDID